MYSIERFVIAIDMCLRGLCLEPLGSTANPLTDIRNRLSMLSNAKDLSQHLNGARYVITAVIVGCLADTGARFK